MSGIRPGSIVHLKASVLKSEDRDIANGGLIAVQFEIADGTSCSAIWVPKRAIIHVEPPPIKVGDCVMWSIGNNGVGVVIAIDGDEAWIHRRDGLPSFVTNLDELASG